MEPTRETEFHSKFLPARELLGLSKIQPFRAEARILCELLTIIWLAWAHHTEVFAYWTLPAVLALIASRQHALLVLMHEATHRRVSRNRLWNDLVGEGIAWNFFVFMHGYRHHHAKHHSLVHLNTDRDPDWARKRTYQWLFPMRERSFAAMILRDILLLNMRDYLQEAKDAENNIVRSRADLRWMIARVAYTLALLSILVVTGGWRAWLLYWILPIFSFLKAIFRIRSIADHFCLQGDHPISKTRTVICGVWDRVIFGPCSIGVHGPHHLYPSVPYYNLRSAHNLLMRNPTYALNSRVCQGYLSAIRECLA